MVVRNVISIKSRRMPPQGMGVVPGLQGGEERRERRRDERNEEKGEREQECMGEYDRRV